MEKHKKEKKKLGLSTKIFIALLTGAVCGVLIHYYMPEGYFRDTILINGILYVLGNGFIRLMQMLVVPLVFCSLVCGAMAIGDTKTLGTVGVKTILFYLCTTALAICVALGIASLINPGVGLNIALPEDATEVATTQVDFAETLLNIIPKNILPLCPPEICYRSSSLLYLSVFFWLPWATGSPLWRTFSVSSMTL